MIDTILELGKILTMYITLPVIALLLLMLLGVCNQNKTNRSNNQNIKRKVPPKGKRPTVGRKD